MGANSTLWTFDNASGKLEVDFTSAFASGSQFLIKQLTGNPTGGVLFEVQAADVDVIVARFGDGTNYGQFSKVGVLSFAGSGGIDAAPPAPGPKPPPNPPLAPEGTGNVLWVPVKVGLPAAGCNNATAGPIWDLPASTPAVAACVTGTNIQKGVLDYADTSGGFSAQ